MTSDSSIDPTLRDAVSASQAPLEYPSPADATANAVKLPPPPSPRSPYHQQPQQQYASYPEDGAYQPAYYGLPPGPQNGPVPPVNGFPAPAPPAPRTANAPPPPGYHYVSSRTGDAKRLRACEACRGLKVRCEPDINGGACRRCLKAGRRCEITPPSRKRQKKTDSRVSELEKQLADIQAQLHIRVRPGASESDADQYDGDQNEVNSEEYEHHDGGDDVLTRFAATPSQQPASRPPPDPRLPHPGAIVAATLTAPLLPYTSSQTAAGQKRLHVEMMQHQPVEAHMYDAPNHRHPAIYHDHKNPSLSQSQPHHSPPSPETSLLASIHAIADSMDGNLGIDLLRQYIRTGLCSDSSTSRSSLESTVVAAAIPAKFELLRHSKPVLFVAIMVLMLRARCRGDADAAPTASSSSKSKVSLKKEDHQALRVLSEAAMGDSNGGVGVDDDEDGEGKGGGVSEGAVERQHDDDDDDDDDDDPRPRLVNPANALMERLRGLDEKDVEREGWFEEVLLGFQ